MTKTVIIDGKEVRMRASALIPRLYRFTFNRDMIQDMRKLQKAFESVANGDEDAQFSAVDLTIFENVAWTMVKHAGEDIPNDPDAWLASIDSVFSIYEIMPTILELWNLNNVTTSKPSKK